MGLTPGNSTFAVSPFDAPGAEVTVAHFGPAADPDAAFASPGVMSPAATGFGERRARLRARNVAPGDRVAAASLRLLKELTTTVLAGYTATERAVADRLALSGFCSAATSDGRPMLDAAAVGNTTGTEGLDLAPRLRPGVQRHSRRFFGTHAVAHAALGVDGDPTTTMSAAATGGGSVLEVEASIPDISDDVAVASVLAQPPRISSAFADGDGDYGADFFEGPGRRGAWVAAGRGAAHGQVPAHGRYPFGVAISGRGHVASTDEAAASAAIGAVVYALPQSEVSRGASAATPTATVPLVLPVLGTWLAPVPDRPATPSARARLRRSVRRSMATSASGSSFPSAASADVEARVREQARLLAPPVTLPGLGGGYFGIAALVAREVSTFVDLHTPPDGVAREGSFLSVASGTAASDVVLRDVQLYIGICEHAGPGTIDPVNFPPPPLRPAGEDEPSASGGDPTSSEASPVAAAGFGGGSASSASSDGVSDGPEGGCARECVAIVEHMFPLAGPLADETDDDESADDAGSGYFSRFDAGEDGSPLTAHSLCVVDGARTLPSLRAPVTAGEEWGCCFAITTTVPPKRLSSPSAAPSRAESPMKKGGVDAHSSAPSPRAASDVFAPGIHFIRVAASDHPTAAADGRPIAWWARATHVLGNDNGGAAGGGGLPTVGRYCPASRRLFFGAPEAAGAHSVLCINVPAVAADVARGWRQHVHRCPLNAPAAAWALAGAPMVVRLPRAATERWTVVEADGPAGAEAAGTLTYLSVEPAPECGGDGDGGGLLAVGTSDGESQLWCTLRGVVRTWLPATAAGQPVQRVTVINGGDFGITDDDDDEKPATNYAPIRPPLAVTESATGELLLWPLGGARDVPVATAARRTAFPHDAVDVAAFRGPDQTTLLAGFYDGSAGTTDTVTWPPAPGGGVDSP